MAEDKFDVEVVTVNASQIPEMRFRRPTRSRRPGSASSSSCVVVLALQSLPRGHGPTRGLSGGTSTEILRRKRKEMRCVNAAKHHAVRSLGSHGPVERSSSPSRLGCDPREGCRD